VAGGTDLFRLRTATDGPVIRAYVDVNRVLRLRNDVTGAQLSSGVTIAVNTWRNLELCGTVGSAGTWSLYVDGVRVVTNWATNVGATPVGRVQIGDTAAKTWSINFDDVVVDLVPGGGA
jgi:hypothetical protein